MIIAIVGMPGSGKTETATFFKDKGWDVLRFGSVIDDGLKEEGLPWSPENNNYYREKVRKEFGMAGVAIKMITRIKKALEVKKEIVLDGLYSWEEYVYLQKELSDLKLLCIYARPSIRYSRLNLRKERNFSKKEARERDIHEIITTNKGGPIAIADYLIKNESTIDNLHKELEQFLTSLNNDLL